VTRVAAVTGGAGAIGSAIAATLRASGHAVAILDRPVDPPSRPATPPIDLPSRPAALPIDPPSRPATPPIDPPDLPVDLADQAGVQAAAATLLARHGRCDVLVHAAAAFDRAPLADLDLPTWRRVQAVNVESALWLAQALTPGMAERRFGRIVFVVSDTVWDPPAADLLAYVASKAALIGMARTLARSLGRDGITVNCVAPGLTPTPAAVAGTPPEAFAAVRSRQAIDRDLAPSDVAAAVAFLVSEAAGAITGQTLCTDGGLILR
jgi:NAD(P)-dependent dehydrogenase (short-subunit alcohol dehydrogenase family)